MTSRDVNRSGEAEHATALSRARLSRGGPKGADAMVWSMRVAGAALVLSSLWWVTAAVRPLPAPEIEPLPAVPDPPAIRDVGLEMAQREQLLAALTADNMFNPLHTRWETPQETDSLASKSQGDEAASDAAPKSVEEAMMAGAPGAIASPQSARAYEEVPIAPIRELNPATRKALREVELRGVYGRDGELVAMIGKVSNDPRRRTGLYRVGDTFDEGAWRVQAIDGERGRVILSRNGNVNIELRLYDDLDASQAMTPFGRTDALHGSADTQGAAVIAERSVEQVRDELLKAGVDLAEIQRLLKLAQSDELDRKNAAEADSADDEQAQSAQVSAAKKEVDDAKTPRGLGSILRLMSRNPFEAPKPDAPAASDNKANDASPDDEGG